MDADFSQKLSQLLSDPSALEKIKSVAEGINAGALAPKASSALPLGAPPEQKSALPSSPDAFLADFALGSDPRLSLLAAVKPLLREDKRERIDALTRAMTVMTMLKNLK